VLQTHKLVLVSASAKFRDLICDNEGCIELNCDEDLKGPDVDLSSWKLFLRSLYPAVKVSHLIPTQNNENNEYFLSVTTGLLFLASRYSVNSVVESIEELLIGKNLVDLNTLKLASRFGLQRLERRCIRHLVVGWNNCGQVLPLHQQAEKICQASQSLSKDTIISIMWMYEKLFGSFKLIPRNDYERARRAWQAFKLFRSGLKIRKHD